MKSIIVFGAGQIGAAICGLLAATGDYAVTAVDSVAGRLGCLAHVKGVRTRVGNARDPVAIGPMLEGAYAVLSALPYDLTVVLAEAAAAAGAHYLDLTEDVASTRRVKSLAATARVAMVPQCGLAPGFVSIAAASLATSFDEIDAIRLRVGALPQHPTNALGYHLTWSVAGLINEYCEPCEAIVDGHQCEAAALEGLETLRFDGRQFEAFNTSGGLGTLCDTFRDRVRTLDYKTVRYPGHAAIMRVLLRDLRLGERRDLLRDILERAIPTTDQDMVLINVTVEGRRGGRFAQDAYASRILADARGSAIQITTASAICAVLDLVAEGSLPQAGLIRQEEIPLGAFLANRFGRAFDVSGSSPVASSDSQDPRLRTGV